LVDVIILLSLELEVIQLGDSPAKSCVDMSIVVLFAEAESGVKRQMIYAPAIPHVWIIGFYTTSRNSFIEGFA
jgi:hypothetical protein